MSIRWIRHQWAGGGLLVIVACLASICRAQPDTPGASECERLRVEVGDLSEVVVDTGVLEVINNDVQILANCLPADGIMTFADSELPFEGVLEIKRSITIRGNGALVRCQNDDENEGLKIRSDNVTVSDIVFESCNSNNSVGLIDIDNSKNVMLEDLRFVGNENVAGPGCISVLRSEIGLLRVEARNNSGSLGGVLSAQLDSNITIMDSFFSDNKASDKGGAIYFNNSGGEIVDVTFADNTALRDGGAVFVEGVLGSKVVLENVTFSGNRVDWEFKQGEDHGVGGAVALVGPKLKANIKGAVFARNFAPVAGGGLWLGNGLTVSILDSRFFENSALLGGAIYGEAAAPDPTKLKVRGTTFRNNSAEGNIPGVPGFGGAIALFGNGTSSVLVNVTFSQNSAKDGGGAISGGQIRSLSISKAIFTRNHGTKGNGESEAFVFERRRSIGGAVLATNVLEISIEKSRFVGNQVESTGGGLHIVGNTVSNVSIIECLFDGNSAVGDPLLSSGGALYLNGDRVQASIQASNFTDNKGRSGGAVTGFRLSSLEISHSSLSENKAETTGVKSILGGAEGIETFAEDFEPNGGAVFLLGVSETSIFNSSFVHNEAGSGGGMYVQATGPDGSIVRIESSVFSNNEAINAGGALLMSGHDLEAARQISQLVTNANNGSGGGIFLLPSILLINGSGFKDNIAKDSGGAVALLSTNATIEKSSFTGNVGNAQGGAIHSIMLDSDVVKGDTSVRTSDVQFAHNSAVHAGGALFLLAVNLQMVGGLCKNNSAGEDGGAIYLIQLQGSVPNATIASGSFIENQAELGGAIFLQTGNLNLSHSDFENNVAQNGGGALYCEDPGLNLVLGHRDSVIAVHFSNFSGNKAGQSIRGKGDVEVTSIYGKGGAFLMTGLGLVLDFKNCSFSENAAGSGGAGHLQDVKRMTLEDSNFHMGSALTGGALAVINAGFSFTANNVTFFRNAARWGGAVSLSLSVGIRFDGFLKGPVSLTQARFVENVATRGGGAVDLRGRTLECASCLFDSNSAGADGGALRGLSTSNVTLVDSTIENCTAAQSGGGISLEDTFFLGENVTIRNNAAVENGGGFAVHFATFAGKQEAPWRCNSCRIQRNKAAAGGGVHVSMEEVTSQDCGALEAISSVQTQHQRFELLADCDDALDETDLRRPQVLLESTDFEGNFAKDSGSHIFLGNFNSTICCDNHCWNMGNGASEALQKCGLSETPTMEEKTTALLGTSFQSVVLTPSRVVGHASGTELPAIIVTALDSLDQLAVANVNLKIGTMAPGVELFGSPIAREGVLMSGEITVTGVFMRALPGNYDLFFELTSEDRVLNESLSVEIRDCVIGEVSREGGLRCDECPDDSFSFDVTDENCTPCPVEKARCSGGTLAPLDGFWRSGPLSSQVHPCLSKEACTYPNRTAILFASSLSSPKDRKCAQGYRDVLCGSCDGSHGKSRFKCTECQGEVPAGLGVVVVMLALAVVSLIYVKSAAKYSQELLGTQPNTVASGPQGGFNLPAFIRGERGDSYEQAHRNVHQNAPRKTRASDIFKILVNFLQVTGSAAAINVGWTKSMLAIFTAWDVISGVADSNSFFSFECAFSSERNDVPRSIQASIFLGFLPIMVWAALATVHYGHALKSKKSFQDIKLWSCIALLAVLQASYISVTRTLVRIFNCVDVSPMEGSFWIQDTSVGCYKGSHAFLVGFVGAPGLLLITMGFPGWLLFKLTRSEESLEREQMVVRYGFLYQAYKRNVAAWEVVILLRKALLATIVVFGRTLGEGIQGNLALFIMMGSIVLQTQYQPFLQSKLNVLELGSLVISTFAFIIGNLVDQPRMSDGGRVVMSIVFIGVMLIFVAYMVKQIFDVASLELRERMEGENLGGQLPTNDFGLLIAATKSQVKKMKKNLKAKKVAFMGTFS